MHWTRHAAEQGAHLVAFPEMVLTGYPVEDLALRSSFVEASRAALRALAARLADEGFGELPVIVGYLDRSERAQPRYGQPAGAPQNAAAVLHRGEVALTLRQAPPAQLRRVRRVPLLRARRHHAGRSGCTASTWRSPSARTSGRTAAGCPAARSAGAGLLLSDQRLAVRAGQGRHPAGAGAQAGPGGRLHHRVPGDDRRPGRAGLRRRLDRRRPGRRSRRAGPAVRRGLRGPRPGSARRRRRAARRASWTTGCASTTSSSPRSRCPRYEPELAGGYAERLDDDEEIYSALVVGPAGVRRRRTASARC